MQEQFNRQNKLPAFITEEKGIPLSLRIFYVLGKSAPLFAARFSRLPHASKIPANLTACGTPGAAGNVTQTHDLLDASLRMFVPVNLCGWMGYVAHPTPDSRELCNSCPAWGGDLIKYSIFGSVEFQFTPPRGGRRESGNRAWQSDGFQFTPPRGGRPPQDVKVEDDKVFQFTPPRGGRLSPFSTSGCSRI